MYNLPNIILLHIRNYLKIKDYFQFTLINKKCSKLNFKNQVESYLDRKFHNYSEIMFYNGGCRSMYRILLENPISLFYEKKLVNKVSYSELLKL